MDINTNPNSNLEFQFKKQPEASLPQLGLVALYDVCFEKQLEATQNAKSKDKAEPVFVTLNTNLTK